MSWSGYTTSALTGPSSILVTYRGEPAALVGSRRFNFVGDVRHRPAGDPVVRVVAHMAYYAQLVLAGERPAPYIDSDAERFARLALIDPDELHASLDESDAQLAARFRIPPDQIRLARTEHGGPDAQ